MNNLINSFVFIISCLSVIGQESYSFLSEERNIDAVDIKLYGTLLIPEINDIMPVALIISGSGSTDRDGNQPNLKNNSLKYLAEGLAKNGIASLRYDKCGVGQSKINISESDLRFEDYVKDAQNWISELKKDHRFNKVIVIGHSEGSLIGMIVAKNANADKYISIAGISKTADQIILEQTKSLPSELYSEIEVVLDSLRHGIIVKNTNPKLAMLLRPSVQPYMISWIKYNPSEEIKKLNVPILIIQGTTDIQVGVENAQQLADSNKNTELKIIENMNHILKNSEMDRTKNIATYMNPDLPINEEVIPTIVDFINH